jgi:hypothetical protein
MLRFAALDFAVQNLYLDRPNVINSWNGRRNTFVSLYILMNYRYIIVRCFLVIVSKNIPENLNFLDRTSNYFLEFFKIK